MRNAQLIGGHDYLLTSFLRDEDGLSAVEFALLLPVMLTLYLGGVEVTQGVSIDRKVTLVSHTAADLVAQASATPTSSEITNIFTASTAVAAPYSTTPLTIVVSSVLIDANQKATIDWSRTYQGTARTSGTDVSSSIPSALKAACATATQPCSVIWGEASYTYKPTIGYVVTGTMNLSDQIFMKPRNLSKVGAPT